jgi:hypothetical protein
MCDSLVVLAPSTANGVTLFAKNSDRPPNEIQAVEWHESRVPSGPEICTHIAVEPAATPTHGILISRPLWCWGVEHGVNDAGVAIGNESIFTTLDPRAAPVALTGLDLVRLGLERAGSAAEALQVIVTLIERYGQGGTAHDPAAGEAKAYWSSFLIADPGDAYVLETSGREWASERVTSARAISNRTTIPGFDATHRHPRQPVETLVNPRWESSKALLATERIERGAVERHLRSHDQSPDGWNVCMHTEREATTASMIAELRPDRPAVAWMLVGWPCRTDYRRYDLAELTTVGSAPG